MSAVAVAAPAAETRPRRSRLLALAAASAVVGALLVLGLGALLGGSERPDPDAPGAVRTTDGALTLRHPAGWRAVDAGRLARVSSHPVAVLQRPDGRGLVVVRRQGRLTERPAALVRGLTAQLRRRFSDFRAVSARRVQLPAGPAIAYTFARTRAGTVHTTVLVPAGARSYALDAVASSRAPGVAREVGAIIRSLGS